MLVASIAVRCSLALDSVAVGRSRSFELGPLMGFCLVFLSGLQIVIMMRYDVVSSLDDNIQEQHLP